MCEPWTVGVGFWIGKGFEDFINFPFNDCLDLSAAQPYKLEGNFPVQLSRSVRWTAKSSWRRRITASAET